MDLETKVELLAGEIADMKEEIGETMAEMRELLTGQPAQRSAPNPIAGGIATLRSTTARAPAKAGAEGPHRVTTGSREGGGLSLSQQDLELMLREAEKASVKGAGADHQGTGKVGLPLDRLVRAIRDGANRATQGTGENDGELNLSLDELARMLKESQAGAAEVSRADGQSSSEGRAGQSPTANAWRPPRPLVGSWGAIGKLDVNLLANLMRWVGSVKCRLGVQQMRLLVELYRLTGHLTPIVEKAITRLASLRILPDESDHHVFTQDDLIDTLLQLHGINYGSGSLPVGPAVELDLSDTAIWPTSQGASTSSETPEEVPATLASEAANGEGWETPNVYGPPPVSISPSRSQRAETAPQVRRPSRTAYEEALSAFRAAMLDSGMPGRNVRAAESQRPAPSYGPREAAPAGPHGPVPAHVGERSSNGGPGLDGLQQGDARIDTMAREAYPSDVTDAQWRQLETLVPPVKPGGRPGKYDRREILNAILYQVRTGCSWRSLPHDLPPWKIVHHYYRTWRGDGSWEAVSDTLDVLLREPVTQEGRSASAAWTVNGISSHGGDPVGGEHGGTGGEATASRDLPLR